MPISPVTLDDVKRIANEASIRTAIILKTAQVQATVDSLNPEYDETTLMFLRWFAARIIAAERASLVRLFNNEDNELARSYGYKATNQAAELIRRRGM